MARDSIIMGKDGPTEIRVGVQDISGGARTEFALKTTSVGADGNPGEGSVGTPQTPTEVAVSTTALRCGGATSWTGANPNTALRRIYNITNLSGTLYAYVKRIATGDAAAGSVSGTSYDYMLAPGEAVLGLFLPAGYDWKNQSKR
mgnify:CR=1 FL=1